MIFGKSRRPLLTPCCATKRMAPPQTAPPTRVKPANHRTDPDENFVNDDWDNDVKAEADGHVSPKSAEEAGNRARRDKEAPLNSSR